MRIQFAVLAVTTGYIISLTETLGLTSLLDGLIDPVWIIEWEDWVEDIFDKFGLEPPGKVVRELLHKIGNYEGTMVRDLMPGPNENGPSLDAYLDVMTTILTDSDSIVDDIEEILEDPEVRSLTNVPLQTMMIKGMMVRTLQPNALM